MNTSESIVPGLSVLVASDGAIAQELVNALAAANASCRYVDAADAAVERAMSEDFDIVMLDTALPGIGAAAAADILRRVGNSCFVVALERAVQARPGAHASHAFDAWMSLPAENGVLLAVIAQARARHPSSTKIDTFLAEECADLAFQFRADLPAMLQAVHDAAAGRDIATLASLVHKLKGTAATYGFPQVTDQCASIEMQLRQGLEDAAVCASQEMVETVRRGL